MSINILSVSASNRIDGMCKHRYKNIERTRQTTKDKNRNEKKTVLVAVVERRPPRGMFQQRPTRRMLHDVIISVPFFLFS